MADEDSQMSAAVTPTPAGATCESEDVKDSALGFHGAGPASLWWPEPVLDQGAGD